MDLPVLPVNDSPLDLERNSFGLCDVDGFDVFSVAAVCLDSCWVVVVGFRLVERPADFWDIDMNDFLLVGVEDGAEVEGK